MDSIYSVAKECIEYASLNITKIKNRIYRGNVVFTDYDIVGDLAQWEKLLLKLHSAIQKKYPSIAGNLKEYIDKYDEEPIVQFSSILSLLDCLLSIEDAKEGKCIFISHSSKDKQCVTDFVDHILCLGIGINQDDIFCTSIEDLGIRNGEDVRRHIHENIRSAEYSFLMISDNYKGSEICVNEMGAVWAYDANVRLYMLPNADIKSIGWLCDTRIAQKLSDPVALDQLYNEMRAFFSITTENFEHWSRIREEFVKRINVLPGNN